jgi:hypothetical protein
MTNATNPFYDDIFTFAKAGELGIPFPIGSASGMPGQDLLAGLPYVPYKLSKVSFSSTDVAIMNETNDNNEMKTQTVSSTSDARVVNNVMRHEYRVLSDAEKVQMQAIKDKGVEFLALINSIDDSSQHVNMGTGKCKEVAEKFRIARERLEEAVMWAVKGLTT